MSCAALGVDPGTRGGLAVLNPDGVVLYARAFHPSMTHHEFVNGVIRPAVQMLDRYPSRVVYVEKVGHIRGDGAQGSFTFGRVDGLIRGALIALGHTPLDVYPAAWQSTLECMSGGNKNVTKRRAIELFGAQVPQITHMTADALLIAEYGRRRSI